jgi:hypothetical protein
LLLAIVTFESAAVLLPVVVALSVHNQVSRGELFWLIMLGGISGGICGSLLPPPPRPGVDPKPSPRRAALAAPPLLGVLAASAAFVVRSVGGAWLMWTTCFLAGFFGFLVARACVLEIIWSSRSTS